jgi:hypothetical protein
MPLARYFLYVGGVLLALLFVADMCLPKLPVGGHHRRRGISVTTGPKSNASRAKWREQGKQFWCGLGPRRVRRLARV